MRFINKTIYSTLAISLFISGCSTSNNMLNTNSSLEKYQTKEHYIKEATNGNLDAMLALNKYYKYPYTKEGLQNYTKWFESVKSSKNNKKVFELAKIYSQYEQMFIGGNIKSKQLFNIALQNSDFNTKLNYLNHLIKKGDSLAIDDFMYENLNSFNEKELSTLAETFSTIYSYSKRKSLKKIYEKMQEKSYKLPISYYYNKINEYKTSKEEKKKIHHDIFTSNNIEDILSFGKLAQKSKKYRMTLEIYEKALELGSKDIDALYYVGKEYLRNGRRNSEKSEKGIQNLKEASKKGHVEASLLLISHYITKKEFLDEYIALKNEFSKVPNSKELLAKHFHKKYHRSEARKIYEELEKEGNENALIYLALQKARKYDYTPELEIARKKRVEKILNSNNPMLIDKYYKTMSSSDYAYNFEKELLAYQIKEANSGNILMSRELFRSRDLKKEERLNWLNKAIEFGDIKSYYTLASDYNDTFNLLPADDKKVLEIYNKLYERGDNKAIKKLAFLYRYGGNGVTRDKQKAAFYFKQLVEQKDLDAYRFFATEYICGSCNKSKTPQYEKAYKYVHYLAQRNDLRNIINLGWLYESGHGIKKDYKKAAYWYEKAAKQDRPHAMRNLGLLYQNGHGVEKDYKKAYYWYEKAHKKNNTEATNDIGYLYENGYGVKKDYKKALSYYKEAIKKRNSYGMHNAANLYLDGKGVNKNAKKAIEYLERAAKINNDLSINLLGTFYYKGQHVKQDYKKAMEYYQRASKLGNKDSFYNIGLLYEKGLGVKKDINKAISFFEKYGTKSAKERIQKLKK